MDFQNHDGTADFDADDGGDELMFDGPDLDLPDFILPAATIAPPEPAPQPDTPAAPARAARKGRKVKTMAAGDEEETSAAGLPLPSGPATAVEVAAPLPRPAETDPPAPPSDAVETVSGPDAPAVAPPAAVPVVPVHDRRITLMLAMAAFAATVSAVGGIVTARNLAALAHAEEEVAAQRAQLARVPALIGQLEALSRLHRTELARAAAARPRDAATRTDLADGLNRLRFALSRSQPQGTTALAGVVREGQAELSTRIERLDDRIVAIEGRGGPRH